jgi:hypothetical protein
MRICILCEDSKVEQVRIKMKTKNILIIPTSESGMLPATHWFCCMAVTQEKADKLLELAELTTMEISEPKIFLDKWNLKMII